MLCIVWNRHKRVYVANTDGCVNDDHLLEEFMKDLFLEGFGLWCNGWLGHRVVMQIWVWVVVQWLVGT
jgi:hypothetical protein